MEPSQGERTRGQCRDRISVDLRGLKAALAQRAQVLGVSPSDLVRTALAGALANALAAQPAPDESRSLAAATTSPKASAARVRLCMRMRPEHARAAVFASRRHRLSLGDYLAALVAEVPVLAAGGSRDGLVAELRASSAELSTLSRNIHRLSVLLRQADAEPARAYRQMLDTVAGDIRSHLILAANALAQLQPRSAGPAAEPADPPSR
jgi:hypothetical protein